MVEPSDLEAVGDRNAEFLNFLLRAGDQKVVEDFSKDKGRASGAVAFEEVLWLSFSVIDSLLGNIFLDCELQYLIGLCFNKRGC